MKNKGARLDVPGFSYGTKTGEFVDVPRIFGGKPQPRKSGKPHVLSELLTAKTVSRARKALQVATQIAKEDYYRRKRVRYRELKKAITNDTPARPCNRRFMEHMGMNGRFLKYEEQPELFVSGAKIAYEITDGFCPMVTTTSVREAQIICASLARYGIGSYITRIRVPF